MAVYKMDGTELSELYDKDGVALLSAWDKNANLVFSAVNGLTVASYNVGGWYYGGGTNVPAEKDDAYYRMQFETLQNINADILCIEEFWTMFSQSGRTAASLLSQFYPYIETRNGTDQYFGRAICSKYPITSYTSNLFTGETKRYYDVASINVYGRTIYAFVTHFSTSSDASVRVTEATEINNYIDAKGFDKFFVCGDFNVAVLDPLSEYNRQVFGPFLNDGDALANGGAFGVFETYSRNSTYDDNLSVDNIIVSKAFTIDAVHIDTTKVTFQATNGDKIDHIPLVAHISFN